MGLQRAQYNLVTQQQQQRLWDSNQLMGRCLRGTCGSTSGQKGPAYFLSFESKPQREVKRKFSQVCRDLRIDGPMVLLHRVQPPNCKVWGSWQSIIVPEWWIDHAEDVWLMSPRTASQSPMHPSERGKHYMQMSNSKGELGFISLMTRGYDGTDLASR